MVSRIVLGCALSFGIAVIATGTASAEPEVPTPPLIPLGQHPVPSAPGSGAPVVAPTLNPWNNQYLLPQNVVPSAPGEGEIFGVAPGEQNADISSIDYLRRLVDTYRAGGLEGGLLGQNPVEGVGQPLPPESPKP